MKGEETRYARVETINPTDQALSSPSQVTLTSRLNKLN